MWLDDEAWSWGTTPPMQEWPDWYVIRPYELKGAPYLVAVFNDGTEVGPYPVVLPRS